MKSFIVVMRVDYLPDGYSQKNIRLQLIQGIGASNALNPDNITVEAVEELRPMPDLAAKDTLSEDDTAYLNNLRESLEIRRDTYNSLASRIANRLLA